MNTTSFLRNNKSVCMGVRAWPAALRHCRGLCDDNLAAELGLRRSYLSKQRVSRRRDTAAEPRVSAALEGHVARISTAVLKDESAAASLTEIYTGEAKQLYDESKGFIGSLLLLDGTRRARSITMWRDVSAMEAASNHPRYAEVMGRVAANFADAPESETWALGASFFADPSSINSTDSDTVSE